VDAEEQAQQARDIHSKCIVTFFVIYAKVCFKQAKKIKEECKRKQRKQRQEAEVGTRYFFRSPLPQVHYLEIVLLLCAGPQLSKIW
jgi:hypothetical protein